MLDETSASSLSHWAQGRSCLFVCLSNIEGFERVHRVLVGQVGKCSEIDQKHTEEHLDLQRSKARSAFV